MYIPKPFHQSDFENIKGLMRANPLATIIVHTDGIHASHIPLCWENDGSEYGVLLGHAFKKIR